MPDYFDFPLRVRYSETDQMGFAYYANYLVWFEVGRAEYCRRRGFSYEEMERTTQSFLVVVEAHCRYSRPLRYDAPFVVRTRLDELRSRMLRFSYELFNQDGEVCARGYTRHAVTGRDGQLKSFPKEYFEYLDPRNWSRSKA